MVVILTAKSLMTVVVQTDGQGLLMYLERLYNISRFIRKKHENWNPF